MWEPPAIQKQKVLWLLTFAPTLYRTVEWIWWVDARLVMMIFVKMGASFLTVSFGGGGCLQYEPELFPGLIYRMKQPKIVLLIFVSGKIVLTGAKVYAPLTLGQWFMVLVAWSVNGAICWACGVTTWEFIMSSINHSQSGGRRVLSCLCDSLIHWRSWGRVQALF